MGLNTVFFLILFSFQALADSTSAMLCLDDDPLISCAIDLCGPPNTHQSLTLREYNFERFVSKEALATLPKVKAELEKAFSQKIAQNKQLIDLMVKKKASGSLLPDFKSLSKTDWDQLAINVYMTHLGFNPYYAEESNAQADRPVDESVTKGLQDFAKNESTCVTAACRRGIIDYLQKDLFERQLEELRLKVSNPALLKERLPYCLSDWASRNLKQSHHREIQKALPKLIDQFISSAMSSYSDHSRQAFRTYMKDKVEIEYQGPSDTPESFMEELKRISEEDQKSSNDLDLMLHFRDGRKGMDPLADFEMICPKKFVSVGNDYFAPGDEEEGSKSSLNISLGSQMDPHIGEGILYHELGHALSHVIGLGNLSKPSANEFFKMRGCVKSLSPWDLGESNNIVGPHAGDHEYTEEDTADIISYKVLGTKPGPLTECSLLRQSSDKTEYEKLAIDGKNSHSSAIVRLIREAMHRGRPLSASCQQVIEENKSKFAFKKCF